MPLTSCFPSLTSVLIRVLPWLKLSFYSSLCTLLHKLFIGGIVIKIRIKLNFFFPFVFYLSAYLRPISFALQNNPALSCSKASPRCHLHNLAFPLQIVCNISFLEIPIKAKTHSPSISPASYKRLTRIRRQGFTRWLDCKKRWCR